MRAHGGIHRRPGGHHIWLWLGLGLWLVLTLLLARLIEALVHQLFYLFGVWFFLLFFNRG